MYSTRMTPNKLAEKGTAIIRICKFGVGNT